MDSVINIFFKAHGTRPRRVLGCMILAGLFGGIGVASLLPLLSLATGEGATGSSPLSQAIAEALASVGLEPTIGVLLSLIASGIALKAGLLFLAMTYVGYAVAHVATSLRERLIRHLLDVKWRYFIHQPLGGIANAMSVDATRAGQAYLASARVIAHAVQALAYCLVALIASWKLALLALCVGALIMGSLHFLVRAMRKAGLKQTERTRELVSYLTDALGNIKPLKAMDRQASFALLFDKKVRQLRGALRKQFISRFALESGQEFLAIVFLALGFYAAATYWAVPISELVVIGILFFQITHSLAKVQRYLQKAVQLESPYWNVERMITEAEAAKENRIATRPARFEREIALDGVSFTYGERELLDGIDLRIPKGKLVLLRGPSGAGKTTITDLILHFITPDSGTITIDDVPLNEIRVEDLRARIGYVPQDLVLFHDTVRANVTLGDPRIGDGEVRRALEAAGAWDFVATQPEGLDAVVGEKGARLSGGQRQRIALARAIAAKPDLLILDEVTSALDPETERDICVRVAGLAGETTIFAISHRGAWERLADLVYEIDGGSVQPAQEHDGLKQPA
jgi:ATP-binding cassette subfamily C protein